MPYLQPFSYGNVLAQGENILNARAQRDPNSLKNQLLRAKIFDLTNPDAGGLEYGKVNPGSFTPNSLAAFEAAGGGPENFGLLENYAAPQIIDIGGVPHRVSRSGTGDIMVTKIPLSTLQGEMGGEAAIKGAGSFASESQKMRAQAGYDAPVAPGELNLSVQQATPTAASLAADKVTAQEQAKAEVARTSPEAQAQVETRLADNLGIQETISELLTKDKSGKTMLSYAYGRANVVLPDAMKAQGWVDAEALRNRVVASLQLENVKKLKGTGPITENEQKILAQAASILANPLISPERAEKEMRRVNTMFGKWAADNRKMLNEPTQEPAQDDDPLGLRQ